MSWPRNSILANDPARQKSRFTGGGDSTDYFARVQRFNKSLYQPSDTKVQTEALPQVPSLTTSRGWQTGNPLAIAARYGTPGTAAPIATRRNLNRFGVYPVDESVTATAPRIAATGAAGDTGAPGEVMGPPAPRKIVSTAEMMGPTAPGENAQTRWMGSGGTQRTWNKAQATNGVRPRIDARATQAPQNSAASAAILAGWAEKRKLLY